VSRGDSWEKRAQGAETTIQDSDATEDGGAIVEFFGQLWFVPDSSPSPHPRVQGEVKARGDLVWIRRDKWEKSEFSVEDCYPIGDRDVWYQDLVKLNFAERIWAKGERKSFAQRVGEEEGVQDLETKRVAGSGEMATSTQIPTHLRHHSSTHYRLMATTHLNRRRRILHRHRASIHSTRGEAEGELPRRKREIPTTAIST
jgi:hypothetical protein